MWPFLEYWDRKKWCASCRFFCLNNWIFLAPKPIFFDIFERVWLCGFEKYCADLRGKIPQHSVWQKGLSVQIQPSGHGQLWVTNMTINEVRFSQNTWDVMRAHHPCCQKRWLVPCMHHGGAFCQESRLRRQPAPRSTPLPIMCWDYHPPAQCHREERPEERRKTPYSLDINLITTQLSTAANRRVVNRFSYNTSWIGLTMSSCASPRHARDLSLIFSKILLTFNQDHHSFVAECCTHF